MSVELPLAFKVWYVLSVYTNVHLCLAVGQLCVSMETRVSQKEIGCLMVSPSLRGE